MRVALGLAAALCATVASIPALADTSRGALRVSVQVTRSCRVGRSADQVSVGCGSRPQQVQVTRAGRTIPRTINGPTAIAPASDPVTVEF